MDDRMCMPVSLVPTPTSACHFYLGENGGLKWAGHKTTCQWAWSSVA